ncbi:MAG: KpsF/GutQ family sugar-phosphate isomerase [Bacteroidota bacterium]|jgi:arabinose-5-phosphate isomerase
MANLKDKNIESAHKTLMLEADAIIKVSRNLDSNFTNAVNWILKTKGRVIITGVGKSAIIAQKIVATFNSTGTPSVFMHAADAIHGDLGILQKQDVVICISKSGNTPEIISLIPYLKKMQNKLIAIVGNINSNLAKEAHAVLNTEVEMEACPNNLAPTTSTIAQMAMGDALAVCLLQNRNFSAKDFAKFHPGGMLGKQLTLLIEDICKKNNKPAVDISATIFDVIQEISSKRLGATVVLQKNKLKGIVTDGDLRRMLQNSSDISKIKAKDIMNFTPKTIDYKSKAVDALEVMKKYNISQIIALKQNSYFGLVHIQDLIKEGIV